MTEFFSDLAAAELTPEEEGALRSLASLGSLDALGVASATEDVAEFCRGFCNRDTDLAEIRAALCMLDALGWAEPADELMPFEAAEWRITEQGRSALERPGPRQ